MKVITFALQKGGTGKTSSSTSVAVEMAFTGKKVLLIDADPQGNATSWILDHEIDKEFADVLMVKCSVSDAIISTRYPNLSILPTASLGGGLRSYQKTLANEEPFASRRQWAGLKAVVMAKEKRVVGGRESNDVRYFLTSLENIETVKKAIRRHWGIENRLQWCLDVFFGEDGKRHRKDHCP